MNFVIVEDEQFWLDELQLLLVSWGTNRNKDINIVSYSNGEDIIAAYKSNPINCDIIFFDITLKEMSGTQAAQQLRNLGYKNAIIFTTSHTEIEYTQTGFDVKAMQYLLKPIDDKKLSACLNELCDETHFSFSYKGESCFIAYNDIAYFESSGHHIIIYHLDKKIPYKELRCSISEIMKKLPHYFARSRRIHVINLKHINEILIDDITLTNGVCLTIGKTYLKNFVSTYINLHKIR